MSADELVRQDAAPFVALNAVRLVPELICLALHAEAGYHTNNPLVVLQQKHLMTTRSQTDNQQDSKETFDTSTRATELMSIALFVKPVSLRAWI